jgi:ATP-dependent protease ClpP protease subunit
MSVKKKQKNHHKSKQDKRRGYGEAVNGILGGKVTPDKRLALLDIQLAYQFDYGVNFEQRIITLTEEIDYPMFDVLNEAMSFMESVSKKAITIRIKSQGGAIGDALAIVGRLKSSKCQIITEGYGDVMSAATLILACGDLRKISRYSVFMHHEASYEMEGRHSVIKNEMAQFEKEEKQWAKWMSNFSKKNEKFWLTQGTGVNAYFTAEELLGMGVVDEII